MMSDQEIIERLKTSTCAFHGVRARVLNVDFNMDTLSCQRCGEQFQSFPCAKRKFCSPSCFYANRRKLPHTEFDGVVYRLDPVHGYYRDWRGNKLHRKVWEKHNGNIPKGYLVHHKDENKTNNGIENLELLEWGKHTIHHHNSYKEHDRCKDCKERKPKAIGYCLRCYQRHHVG